MSAAPVQNVPETILKVPAPKGSTISVIRGQSEIQRESEYSAMNLQCLVSIALLLGYGSIASAIEGEDRSRISAARSPVPGTRPLSPLTS